MKGNQPKECRLVTFAARLGEPAAITDVVMPVPLATTGPFTSFALSMILVLSERY